jgi:hypothetical protein
MLPGARKRAGSRSPSRCGLQNAFSQDEACDVRLARLADVTNHPPGRA